MDLEDAQYLETACHSGLSLQLGSQSLGGLQYEVLQITSLLSQLCSSPLWYEAFKIIIIVLEYMPIPSSPPLPPRAMIVNVITHIFENRDRSLLFKSTCTHVSHMHRDSERLHFKSQFFNKIILFLSLQANGKHLFPQSFYVTATQRVADDDSEAARSHSGIINLVAFSKQIKNTSLNPEPMLY